MFTALQHEAEAGTEAFLPTLLLFIPALLMGLTLTLMQGNAKPPGKQHKEEEQGWRSRAL